MHKDSGTTTCRMTVFIFSHLLLIWILFGASSAGVFDVTTIYRYDRLGEDFEDVADRFAEFRNFEANYDYQHSMDWSFSNWVLTDNSETFISTPGEGRHTVNIKDEKISPMFPLLSVSPRYSPSIVISLKKYDKENTLLLYLSPDNETRFSDINIIKMPRYYDHSAHLYECIKYKYLEEPISGETRKCGELTTDSESSQYPFDHILVQGQEITLINQQKHVLTNIRRNIRSDVKYVGLRSKEFEFDIWTPVHKWSLAKSRGVIESDKLYHRFIRSVCISVLYYLQPNSDATLRAYLVSGDGSELLLGSARAPTRNVSNPWTTHRFIRELNSYYKSAKIRIVSEKSASADVFVKRITGCRNPDNVNVTTINRNGSVEVYARTNALGLPLLSPDGTALYLDDVDPKPCTMQSENCEWYRSNSTTVPGSMSPREKKSESEKTKSIRMHNEVGSNEIFVGALNFIFSPSENNGQLNIYLMPHNESLSSVTLYYISIHDTGYGTSRLWKCSDNNGQHIQISSSGVYRYCQEVQTGSLGSSYWRDNNEYNFTMSYRNGQIKLLLHKDTSTSEIFNWLDSEPIPIRYYSLGMYGMSGSVTVPNLQNELLILDDMDSITSYPFMPHGSMVCVSVSYYENYYSNEDSFSLQMMQSGEEKFDLRLINSVDMGDGMATAVYAAQLEDEEYPISIQLTANVRNEGSVLVIYRIAGCNIEDNGELHVISSSRDVIDIVSYGYDTLVLRNADNPQEHLECMNGGIFDIGRGGCECPPGFTGPTCENGCGANRFGFDCGGECSVTNRGCKGMTLCRPKLGCSCAPGLKGILCDIDCGPGEYGAGCKQKCGNCIEGPCDPYTGRCPSGCEDGFYPPLCQQNYTHLRVAPDIEKVNFNMLKVKFSTDQDSLKGRGTPRFYQLQIREPHEIWKELQPRLLPSNESIETEIKGLQPGTVYQVRAVFIDKDGNSYQGPEVPTVNVTTKCVVPKEIDYNLQAVSKTEEQFQITWAYDSESAMYCKLIHTNVEMKMDRRWFPMYKGKEMNFTMTKLRPGKLYEVRVRAFTSGGPAPFSKTLSVSTKYKAPGDVSSLQVVSAKSRELELKWEKPLDSAGEIQQYKVSYECQKLLACSKEDCSNSAGQVEVKTTSVILRSLLPHAQYSISVEALAASWGSDSYVLAVTDMAAPEVAPAPSPASPSTVRTNTSITVQWDPPHSCQQLNGYLYEYRYELLIPNDTSHVQEGLTRLTTASFRNLTPHTEYTVKVFAVTPGGWNPTQPLVITTRTRATVPGPVEKLEIYKRDRRTLGIRWAAPKELYGTLQSFTVSYRAPGQQVVRSVLKPTWCVAWPKLYCHTFKSLRSDTEYTVAVQGRNDEVDEDGEPTELKGITKESAPLAPSFVRVVSQKQTSLTLEWGMPDLLNGKLRSFLVNVEETDSFNATSCCQDFPILQEPVRAEQPSYRIQVSDLNPASTYAISVTAKTVSLGPAVSITTHTQPPVPSMDGLIEVQGDLQAMSFGPKAILQPTMENQELIRGYLLVVIPQSADVEGLETSIWNDGLSEEVKTRVAGHFYVAAEFQQAELEDNTEVAVGTDDELKSGKWGEVRNPPLQGGGKYRLGLAVILEYCGVYAVGYTSTEQFHIKTGS
ncbi:uncharacterized protein [Periplaneta americana]|uniref:uncharacterized protein isoform X3 n=1 Tax=Periplaneta americana TaxID=6978 RepID=UPI0037E7223B